MTPIPPSLATAAASPARDTPTPMPPWMMGSGAVRSPMRSACGRRSAMRGVLSLSAACRGAASAALLVRPVGRTCGGDVTPVGAPHRAAGSSREVSGRGAQRGYPPLSRRAPAPGLCAYRRVKVSIGSANGQVHLFSSEQPTPQETARRLIPRREPRLPSQDRLQVHRGHPQVRGEPRQAESGLGQKLGKVKARHAPLPRDLFRRRCATGAHGRRGHVNTNPRRCAGGDHHRPRASHIMPARSTPPSWTGPARSVPVPAGSAVP